MQEEISKIIQMVEAGKISSEDASELINALKEEETDHATSTNDKGFMAKSVKFRIRSEGKDNVNISIPIGFVKWILKTGHGIASSIPEAKAYADDIDMDVVMHAIDHGMEGQIIDLETEEGESVAVYIE